jgi:uncharacterized protein (TIGR01777 family)
VRVVITGAAGFIGRVLSEELAKSGYQVVGLSRNPNKARQALGDTVTVAGWDGKSAGGWERYANGARAIVNLAGESISWGRWTKSKKDRILESRLDAGRAVADAVSQAAVKPNVVVQSSGIGYYGSRSDAIVDESAVPGTGFLCDVAKQWEASTKQVQSVGVRQVVIRTGIVLGVDGGALPRLLTPFRLFLGGPLGSGKQFFPWIHLQDEVQAIRLLIERDDLDGPFNLVAPELLTMRDFCSILGKVMRRPSWFRVPGLALRLLFGEMAKEVLLSGQRAVPQRLVEAGYRFAYSGAESALRQILG